MTYGGGGPDAEIS